MSNTSSPASPAVGCTPPPNPNASPASHLPHATVHNDTRAIQALKVCSKTSRCLRKSERMKARLGTSAVETNEQVASITATAFL